MDQRQTPRGWKIVGRVFGIFGKVLGTLLLVLFLAALVFACVFAVYVKNDLLAMAEFSVDSFALDQTSTIYYQDPDTKEYVELQQLYGEENRIWVSYDKIPKDLVYACVAIEDKRFFDHQGVDWLRTGKACINMFLGGSDPYGASTITQQLIKNLTGEDEVTVRRKLVEIVRALELEKNYSKDEILELYFNTIYLGEGCYGVQSASRVYFGKDVQNLTLAECASLIGITNNPSIYDPYINEEKNRERQETILWQMKEQGYITSEEEYQAALKQEMVFQNGSKEESGESNGYFSYFVDQVIRDVVNDLMEETGYSETIVNQMVRAGGYAIYCTLNPEVQEAVDTVYEDLSNVPNTASSQQLQSAIVIVDNTTGDIVAMSGGVGEKEGSLTLNRATQSYLSPGSTIKPLTVYSLALESGDVTPATVYDDTPYSFTNSAAWPKNQNGYYRGLTSINEAVCQSLNTIPVKLVAELGAENCFRFAKEKLGLSGLVEETTIAGNTYSDIDLSPMALGSLTRGVTVRQMTGAYATFPNQGVYREPRTYTKVVDSQGRTVLENKQETNSAMSETSAWYMTYMLQNAVTSGTGTPAQLSNMAVAGKTGTTTSDNDRWFAGYTPYYTGVVWCGYDDPEEVILTDSSTNPAVVMWQKVMSLVHEGVEYQNFSQPSDVVSCKYCQDSGLLATEACRTDPRGNREVSGLLNIEDAPVAYCDVHVQVEICDESGHVANEYCEQVEGNSVHKAGLLNIVRAFPRSGIYVGDQQYVISQAEVPAGYYPAVSTNPDPISQECYVHTEESLPQEEPDPNEGQNPLDEGSGDLPPTETTEEPPQTEEPGGIPGGGTGEEEQPPEEEIPGLETLLPQSGHQTED